MGPGDVDSDTGNSSEASGGEGTSTPTQPTPENNIGAAWMLLWRRLGIKVACSLGLLALAGVGHLIGVAARVDATRSRGYAAGLASVTYADKAQYIASQKHVGEQREMKLVGLRPDRFTDGDGSYFASYFLVTYQDTQPFGLDTVYTRHRPVFTIGSRMLRNRWYWRDSRGVLHYAGD